MLPSWDLIIPASLLFLAVYAVLLLRKHASSVLIGSYLANLVTLHWGRPLYGLLTGGRSLFGFSLSLQVTPFIVESLLFLSLWLIFSSIVLPGAKVKLTSIEMALFGVSAGGVATSTLLTLMADADRVTFLASHRVAAILYSYQELFFLLPVMLILWVGLRPTPDDRSRD